MSRFGENRGLGQGCFSRWLGSNARGNSGTGLWIHPGLSEHEIRKMHACAFGGASSIGGCYRLPFSFSSASAAESFRSRCGSVRGVPECSSQASPIVAPQVLQGTHNICFRVSSLVFTWHRMQHSQYGKMFNIAHSQHISKAADSHSLVHLEFFHKCEQK
jgi:hypothetical protein